MAEKTLYCPTCDSERTVSSEPARCPLCDTPLEDRADQLSPDELVGKTVGGYKVLSKLSEGGAGVIYEATQLSMRRTVALKVLLPSLAGNQDIVDSFFAEAKQAAQLNHPNIVSIYDIGRAGSVCYYAMELVAGQTLRTILDDEKRLDYKEAIQISITLARALEYAASKGILRPDIGPDKIMLTERREVKLIGLGESVEPGKEGKAGVSVKALGAVLYEACAGATMFSEAVAAQAAVTPIPSLKKADVRIPGALDDLVRQMFSMAGYYEVAQLVENLEQIAERKEEPKPASARVAERHRGAAARDTKARVGSRRGARTTARDKGPGREPAPPGDGEAAAPPARGRPSKAPMALMSLGTTAVLILVCFAVITMRKKAEKAVARGDTEARRRQLSEHYIEIEKIEEAGELRKALANYRKLAKEHPEAKIIDRVLDKIKKLEEQLREKKQEKKESVTAALARVRELARSRPDGLVQIESAWRQLLKQFPKDATVKAVVDGELKQIDAKRKRLETIKDAYALAERSAGGLVAEKKFGDAIALWREFGRNYGDDEDYAELAQTQIGAVGLRARRVFDEVSEQAKKLVEEKKYEEAKALYKGVAATFGVPELARNAAERIKAIDDLLATLVAKEQREQHAERQQKLVQALKEVGPVLDAHKYQQAIAAYEKIAADFPEPDFAGEVAQKLSLAKARYAAFKELIRDVNDRKFVKVRFNLQLASVRLTEASEQWWKGIGGDLPLQGGWGNIEPREMAKLWLRADVSPANQMGVASYCFEHQLFRQGRDALGKAISTKPEMKEEAVGLLLQYLKGTEGSALTRDLRALVDQARAQELYLQALLAASMQKTDEAKAELTKIVSNYGHTAVAKDAKEMLDTGVEASVEKWSGQVAAATEKEVDLPDEKFVASVDDSKLLVEAQRYHNEGLQSYKKSLPGMPNRAKANRQALELFTKAMLLYRKAVELHPKDKGLAERLRQVNMLRYGCMKTMTLRGG